MACGVGVLHFGIAVSLWLLGFCGALWMAHRHGASHITWSVFFQSLPAVALLVGFCGAFRLSRSRPLTAGACFAVLLLTSIASFCYDTTHYRYQIRSFSATDGCSRTYVTWFWWQYDR